MRRNSEPEFASCLKHEVSWKLPFLVSSISHLSQIWNGHHLSSSDYPTQLIGWNRHVLPLHDRLSRICADGYSARPP